MNRAKGIRPPAAALLSPVTPPQGYLTLTSATPIIAADVASATAVYYTPFVGNQLPIYNGSLMVPTSFSELTLTLAAQHALNSHYDVFVFRDSCGVVTIATGPAWTTITAGSGARGTGAGTTELQRVNGFWTNKAWLGTARNGASTYSIPPNMGTYVGSLYIDGTAGQITCHKSYGQSRKWGVWNAYNRQTVELIQGDATASWTYSTATVRQSRADATNFLTTFAGLPETSVAIDMKQTCSTSNSQSGAQIGPGLNVTNSLSSMTLFANVWALGSAIAQSGLLNGGGILPPTIGINKINFLEQGNGTVTMTFNGGSSQMMMTARWLG